MSAITNTHIRSTTLAALKAHDAYKEDDEKSDAASLVVSDTRKVNADTTVTTLVLTSGAISDSRLPNLSLNDVLEQSGVDDVAQVLLQPDEMFKPESGTLLSSGSVVMNQDSQEAVQEAVDALESAEAIVVEVETTNNVQSVTVSPADIDTLYTQAVVQNPSQPATSHSNILLLKNGWAYTRLQNSPLELPVAPPDQQTLDGWAMWRSVEKGVHEIQDAVSGTWSRIVGQVVDTSPKTPADVSGVFKSYAADTQFLYTSSSTTTLKLSADGIFTNTRTSLTTSRDALPNVSYALHTVTSPNGRSASFSGRSQSNVGSSAVITNVDRLSEVASDMFGAYKMLEDGVTLELQFADGSVERKLFLKTEQGDFSVNGRVFDRNGDVSVNFMSDLWRMLIDSGEVDHRGKWMKRLAEAILNDAKNVAESMTSSREQIDTRVSQDDAGARDVIARYP